MKQHVHLIGIGGIGMSAIAKVLLEQGVRVSGSDLKTSPLTRQLAELGATVYEGHCAGQTAGADLVVVSSAVPPDNVEVAEARARGIPVVKRAQFLGKMMTDRFGIAIAGTHGKSTTSAMIALILEEDGLDPTFIVGGIVDNLGTNARAGAGGCFVIEADEYDRTFLGLRPQIAVVTNIEHDHPDCYPDLGSMIDAFREFVTLMPSDGLVVGCGDEAPVRSILGKLAARSTTYGLGEGNDWHAVEVCRNDVGGNDFTALYRGERVGDFRLIIPGRHNVANALAAIAVAHELDIDPEQVASTLASFRGVGRRFETQGEIAGVIIIDDYAHHPTEIRATLAAARERFGTRPVWVVFQPHTYSRTKALLNKFAAAFGDADHVLVTNIFAAREHDDLGISSADLVQAMTHRDARYIGGLDQAAAYLAEHVRSGEVVITIGAGDVYLVGKRLMSALCGRVTSIGV